MAGVVALLVRALRELTPMALEPIQNGQLHTWHWMLLLGWTAANAYAEGYVGFHQKFSPRVVDRALYLGRHPSLLRVVLAAPFCIGLFHARRRVLLRSWAVSLLIVALVIWVRHLAQPWRGIVDAGVVVGLGIGAASLVGVYVHALVTRREPCRHEVPDTPGGPPGVENRC